MPAAYDTVHLHTLIDIPHAITRSIANYIKGRKQYTLVEGRKFKLRNAKKQMFYREEYHNLHFLTFMHLIFHLNLPPLYKSRTQI